MSVKSLWGRLRGHFEEYVARYTVLALAVLTPVAGLLGALAADLGGAGSPGGRAALAVASAVGTAIAAVTFLRNLGIWQMLDTFGTAPGVGPGLREKPDAPQTVVAGGDVSVETAPAPAETASAPTSVGTSPQAPPDAAPPAAQPTDANPPVPDVDGQGELEATDGVPPDDADPAPAGISDPGEL